MQVVKRRTSHEVRGLKYLDPKDTPDSISRTSHEVRGLKCLLIVYLSNRARSHLTRGAWIEIRKMTSARRSTLSRTSHEVRGLK